MATALIYLCGYMAGHNSVSLPCAYYTLSNPAFTSSWGNYEAYFEPKNIGEITVFNVSARYRALGLGFSNYYERLEYSYMDRKNWGSVAYHLKIPLSLGCNFGLRKIYDETRMFFDAGAWFRKMLNFGFCWYDAIDEDQRIRGGVSYDWRQFTFVLELEDSLRRGVIMPHALVRFNQKISDFNFCLSGGYSRSFIMGIELGAWNFIRVQFLWDLDDGDETARALIGINFSPPVVHRQVTVVETLMVEKPLIIKTTKHYQLTTRELKYCEDHYRKGIDLYVNNRIEEAVQEWQMVVKLCPDYKDVQQYLDRAKAKLDLLKP